MRNTLENRIARLKLLRPIDDIFFEVFIKDVGVCEEILRVILQDECLKVESVIEQKNVRNLVGRSVRLDARCVLGDGTKCNIEVQKEKYINHIKRINYNSSCIIASETEPGTDFNNVPSILVVYITEFDLLKQNKTIYHVNRIVEETGEVFNDEVKIVCVNTEIDDGSDIAELMKLFLLTKVDSKKFKEFTRRMKYLKEEGGRQIMCEIIDEYARECTKEYAKEIIKKQLEKGFNPEDIAECFDVTLEYVLALDKERMKLQCV